MLDGILKGACRLADKNELHKRSKQHRASLVFMLLAYWEQTKGLMIFIGLR